MELQVSRGICAKIQEKSVLRSVSWRNWEDIAKFMRVETGKYNRSRDMFRPRTYVAWDTAQNERVGIYGVSQRQEFGVNVLIYQRFTNLMLKYRHREFWCSGYYVDTVGKNTKKIKEYIANQLNEDKKIEQMTMQEIRDPFAKK